ncbi:MAG: hypothetical protein MK161_06465 [Pirellulales bacterium]|nr:hypothetical protein [Pirellulales bacterium]
MSDQPRILRPAFMEVVVFTLVAIGCLLPCRAEEGSEPKTLVLLADDFETPQPDQPLQATTGAWQGNDGVMLKAVVDSSDLPGGPHEKSTKWARLDRADGGRSEGHFGFKDLRPIGGKLYVSFNMYIVRNDADKFPAAAVAEIGLGSTLAGSVNIMAGRETGNRVTSNDGEKTGVDRDVQFKDDTWQAWQIWVDLENKTYEYAVDDAKSGVLKIRNQGDEAFKLIEIEPGTAGNLGKDSVIYLDDMSVTYEVPGDRIALLEEQRRSQERQQQKQQELAAHEALLRKNGIRDAYYLYGTPDDIGHRTQLFLDRSSYADRWDVYERINQPQKAPNNPIMMPDQPWEHSIGLPNVLYDEQMQKFHMWYANYDTGKWGGGKTVKNYKRTAYMMSYAESTDGVHWTKPLMDKVPYMGYEKTNILMTGNSTVQEFVVIHTPEHLRERGRFMLWYRDSMPGSGKCVNVAYSDNGVDWTLHDDNPVYKKALDAQHVPVWDEQRQIWLLYARPQQLAANESRYSAENSRTRISVTVSHDMKNWTPARQVLGPDELDRSDEPGNKGHFFDRMSALKWGNQYIGFLAIQPRHGHDNGWIELATSPDGFRWHRSPLREPFIPNGKEGQWDAGHTWMLTSIVERGHFLYLYYVGASQPWRQRYPDNTRTIGMAQIRKDRFIGQYGDVNGGWVLSREVKVTGNRLVVNIAPEHRAWNHQHHGYVKVELLDRNGGVYSYQNLPGFGQDDCARLRANEYEMVVSWNGNPDLSSLRGKPVYIRFWLKSAYLFGFRFMDQ